MNIIYVSAGLSSAGVLQRIAASSLVTSVYVVQTCHFVVSKSEFYRNLPTHGVENLHDNVKQVHLPGGRKNSAKEELKQMRDWVSAIAYSHDANPDQIDFVIFDYNVLPMIEYADLFKAHGYKVIGPDYFTGCLETVRSLGKTFAAMCGWPSFHKSAHFHNREDALKFMEGETSPYLIKGQYDTILPISIEDTRDFLRNTRVNLFADGGALLEKRLDGGKEMCFDAWFGPNGFAELVCVNQEYKGLNNENRGNNLTGEVGTSGKFVSFHSLPMIIRAAMLRMSSALHKYGYSGFFGVNTIIAQGRVNFLEFTTRFGYPTEHIAAAAYGDAYPAFLKSLTNAELSEDEKTSLGAAIVLRKKNPYFNAVSLFSTVGIDSGSKLSDLRPMVDVSEADPKDFVLFDARYETETSVRATMMDRALIAVSFGPRKEMAIDDSYRTIRKIKAWGHSYRDDIGSVTDVSTVLAMIQDYSFAAFRRKDDQPADNVCQGFIYPPNFIVSGDDKPVKNRFDDYAQAMWVLSALSANGHFQQVKEPNSYRKGERVSIALCHDPEQPEMSAVPVAAISYTKRALTITIRAAGVDPDFKREGDDQILLKSLASCIEQAIRTVLSSGLNHAISARRSRKLTVRMCDLPSPYADLYSVFDYINLDALSEMFMGQIGRIVIRDADGMVFKPTAMNKA